MTALQAPDGKEDAVVSSGRRHREPGDRIARRVSAVRKYAILYAPLALMLSLSTPSASAQELMESAINNTVRIEGTDGTVTNFYFNSDGTYSTSAGGHGTWEAYGSMLCTTPDGGVQNCTEWKARGVGSSWTELSADGDPLELSIIEGR